MLKVMNIVLNRGGLGDHIARLPAVKYMADTNPDWQFILYMPDYTIDLAWLLLKDSRVNTVYPRPLSDINKINTSLPILRIEGESFHTGNRTQATKHAFHILADSTAYQERPELLNYLQAKTKVDVNKFNLPNRYAVVVEGYKWLTKRWRPDIIVDIKKYLLNNGIVPVLLGARETQLTDKVKSNEIDFDNNRVDGELNLVDKTTVLEALGIIRGAQAILGLDSGLVHLAACTDRPIIVGYTLNTKAEHYRAQGVTEVFGKPCGCQTNIALDFDANFKYCNKEYVGCVTEFTSSKEVIERIERVIKMPKELKE